MAKEQVAATFTAAGQFSEPLAIVDFATLTLGPAAFTGEVQVQVLSAVDGQWVPYLGWGQGIAGPVKQTIPGVQVLWMPEPGTRMRLACTALTAGPIGYRLCNVG